MKKLFIYLLVITLFSCSKDDAEIIQEPVKSSAKQITSFVFKAVNNEAITEDVTAILNETNKTITATVANGTDVKSLTPTIVVSDKAAVNESGAKDFSAPVDYTITAEDGTKTTYKVTVGIALNSAKQILSFAFKIEDNELYGDDTVTATINEANKTITATVSYSANATLLTPSIEVSPDASVSPDIAQDFSTPVVYTVTAEDGSTADYQVTLEISFTDRDALIAIYNANPNNTLSWNLQDKDIANWSGIVMDVEDNVVELRLNNQNLDILPLEIGQLSNLQRLNLNNNHFVTIPSEIGQLKILEDLIIFNNQLVSIPATIGELSELTYLQLTSNELTFLPEEIGKLSNLQELELDGNELTTIPASIGELSNLENIYLYRNKLTSLPPEIGDLTSLTTIYLSENELTSIPKEIGGLANLTGLDLENNKLASIPTELEQLESLTYLNLENNHLTTIPKEIGNLPRITGLYLSENELTSIPKEIGNLTSLTRLYLTTNLLTSIPQEVCDLENTGTEIQLDPDVKCE
ncbi:leucine-rich repeat domain-containing protein [Muriicola sp.]|uniref:leucine-rich repeat domain-containing protein n=1 Tax=Muriicola sp. TaxID=2020856 RepID=UPI003C71F5AE